MNESDLLELEKQIEITEINSQEEEQQYVKENYQFINNKIKTARKELPYKDITPYTTASSYEEVDDITQKKRRNKPYWETINRYTPYNNNGELFCGHIKIGNVDYFFCDKKIEPLQLSDYKTSTLIHTDDRNYQDIFRMWQFPDKTSNIDFSRSYTTKGRIVSNVITKYDTRSELISNVTDRFLIKALISNKNSDGLHSIIVTIQQKQDTIRTFDKDKSFIVQGCAGSGKTMVLLHRLRYLIANRDIYDSQYVLLGPSNVFKDFIKSISEEFGIKTDNIYSYQDFYQKLAGSKIKELEDEDNIINEELLEKIYSEEFLREGYGLLFTNFEKNAYSLISYCDDVINKFIKNEKDFAENELKRVEESLIANSNAIIEPIIHFLDKSLPNDKHEIQPIIRHLTKLCKAKEEELSRSSIKVNIKPDDDRVLEDKRVKKALAEILQEESALRDSSFVTRSLHERKLRNLVPNLYLLKTKVAKELEDEINNNSSSASTEIFPKYDYNSVVDICNQLKKLIAEYNRSQRKLKSIINDAESNVRKKYKALIDKFEKFANFLFNDFDEEYKKLASEINPCYYLFSKSINMSSAVISELDKIDNIDKDRIDIIKNQELLYLGETGFSHNKLRNIIFSTFRKLLINDYNVRISDSYKCYWYLRLQSSYLSNMPLSYQGIKYVYIDEAQDLSVEEMKLIKKSIQTKEPRAVFNLFGDVKQSITNRSISNWESVPFDKNIFELDENFRNTNQIVNYCNKELLTSMRAVGVNLYDVEEIKKIKDIEIKHLKDSVLIVKDESIRKLVQNYLQEQVEYTPEILTVKEAKGLEFKNVVVLQSKMSLNEKYIAFTRALMKLTVIKSL